MLDGVASAHHSGAYDGDETETMQGTLVEFSWRNAHVIVIWDVKGRRWKNRLDGTAVLAYSTQSEIGLTQEELRRRALREGSK